MKTKAWGSLIYSMAPGRIATKPREQGLTMILDRCQGLNDTQDLLALNGDYIDYIKLSFGTSVFVDETLLRRKIELVRAHKIDIYYPGYLLTFITLSQVYKKGIQQVS